MKKILLPLLIITLLWSCTDPNSQKEEQIPERLILKSVIDSTFISTYDTMRVFDEKLNAEIYISLPISGDIFLDSLIKTDIYAKKDEFLNLIAASTKGKKENLSIIPSQFVATTIFASKTDQTVNYKFLISKYLAGAKDAVKTDYEFDYNLQTKKKLSIIQ